MKEIKEILSKEFIINAFKHPFSVFKNQFIRYLIIGFSTVFLDFFIYQMTVTFITDSKMASNLTSAFFSLFFNFTMTNYWTFQAGHTEKAKKISKYLLLALVNYTINNILFLLLVSHLGMHAILAKVIITAIIVCWNFFLYKSWVFKK